MDSDDESHNGKLNLTGILFGNINEKGEVETDYFDPECQRSLNHLSDLGISALVNEIREECDTSESSDDEEEEKKDTHDYQRKAPSAVDFSDINEDFCDDPDDKSAEPPNSSGASTDITNNGIGNEYSATSDKSLMPPPPNPMSALEVKKKLDTPLASMLPSKYVNMDVTELFPEFRPNQVLRFSKLFSSGKNISQSPIWRTTRKKKKGKPSAEETPAPTPNKFPIELTLDIAPALTPDMWQECDEVKLLKPMEPTSDPNVEEGPQNVELQQNFSWRYGPAKFWYDMYNVAETGEGFDYGFKMRDPADDREDDMDIDDYPDEAFLMITQKNWEDEVIWDKDDIKPKGFAKQNNKMQAAGWIPTTLNRTASGCTTQGIEKPITNIGDPIDDKEDQTWYSIFPIENQELIYGKWEEEIIWDAQDMPFIPKPKILTLDENDENIILDLPEDPDPNAQANNEPIKEKRDPFRRTKMLLGKQGLISEPEPPSPPPPQPEVKDKYNISNDEFYNPKLTQDSALKPNVGGNLIQHSIPAIELRMPFFPTHLGQVKLNTFHRPVLKRYSHGNICSYGFHGVVPLLKHIKKKAKAREQERLASGGGEMFFMRTPEDLSGKDGELILAEYCEEHPCLVMQVGMATKIKNYYKRKPGKDTGAPEYKFGETSYAHTSPFLGTLAPGQSIQAFENNLFRAPIYLHNMPDSDFLIIRTRDNYYVRELETIYIVGQELPLFEVPGPNSKKANNFVRDFLQVFIYRLFWKSKDSPRRIKMEDIRKAFPLHSESSIRKRLKLCADFKRTGMDSNWWVLKSEFRLPTEDEIRAMVSPEQCVAYYSMLAAEQRLKAAGYGEKSFFAPEDENDEEMQVKMDDEVKAAPWNTTRAFISAMKGKCLLQLTGIADPTGCGEGFSYVRIPNKPQQSKEEANAQAQAKKTVTGTDADLRRLSLSNAKQLLRKFGVPEEEIKKLSRWEVIDVVRTLSTEQAKAGEEAMIKFARGNRFSLAEHQERYKEECQRIFNLQNKVLYSKEILSTDEDSSSDEDSEIEELGKNIENVISNKKTNTQIILEKEEAERRELQKLIEENNDDKKKRDKHKDKDDDAASITSQGSNSVSKMAGKILQITRTFKKADGKEFTRVETVRKQAVIETYMRIRQTKDPSYIKQFASALDEHQKEEYRRERRRIQEQLRRLKRNALKEKLPVVKKKPKKEQPLLKLKCGACGAIGHMRTNKTCPLYQPSAPLPPIQVAMTEEQEEEEEMAELIDDNLVKVDETKVVLSKTLIKKADEIRRKALLLKFPKAATVNLKKKRRPNQELHCDYLKKPAKSSNRRRTDPIVTLSTILESILNEMRNLPETEVFHNPVNHKMAPEYYTIITKPMDLSKMRERLLAKQYHTRQVFLEDVIQIVDNSVKYNGEHSIITIRAKAMLEKCIQLCQEKDDKLMPLEKAINPLLDDDQVALSFILETIVNSKLKAVPESYPFHKPVNRKAVREYYNIVKNPMDFETILKNIKDHKYHHREEFIADVLMIHKNSEQFNGLESQFTKKSKEIYEACLTALDEVNYSLAPLEAAVKNGQEAAMDAEDGMYSGHAGGSDDQNDMDKGYKDESIEGQDLDDIDVVGSEYEDDMQYEYGQEEEESNILAMDLQITPENSDNEENMDSNMDQDFASNDSDFVMQSGAGGYLMDIKSEPVQFIATEEENSQMVDENYDPSEFLFQGFPQQTAEDDAQVGLSLKAEKDQEEAVGEQYMVNETLGTEYAMVEEASENDNNFEEDIWF